MTQNAKPERWWRCVGPTCLDVRWRDTDKRPCWVCESETAVERYYQPMITSGEVVVGLSA